MPDVILLHLFLWLHGMQSILLKKTHFSNLIRCSNSLFVVCVSLRQTKDYTAVVSFLPFARLRTVFHLPHPIILGHPSHVVASILVKVIICITITITVHPSFHPLIHPWPWSVINYAITVQYIFWLFIGQENSLNFSWSIASLCIAPLLYCRPFISVFIVLHQVVFGWPLCPSSVHHMAVSAMFLQYVVPFKSTWPIHFQRILLLSCACLL